jgi:hypothetical protein
MTPVSLLRLILTSFFALMTLGQAAAQSGLSFPLIGVATGQSARVKALNLGSGSSTANSSCTVTIQILDMQGQTLKQSVVPLQPGKGASLDLSRDDLPGDDLRVEIRALLLFGYVGGAPPGPEVSKDYDCTIVPSIEVFDNSTGKTSFILTDSKVVQLPNPGGIPRIAISRQAAPAPRSR